MGARMWILTKLFPKVAGVVISSGPVIRASKAFLAALRKGYEDIPDENIKGHLVDLELRIEKLESSLEALDKGLRKMVTAMFLIGAVALAALVLAIIKLA